MIVKNFFGGSVKLIYHEKIEDKRGSFLENYNSSKLKKFKITNNFLQDNISYSKDKGTLRGMHFQTQPFSQSKLITVVQGKIQDIVVDLRRNSKTFGKYKSSILSAKNRIQLYVSSSFAHGFLVLEKDTIVTYKVDKKYSKKNELSILWSDNDLNINWKIKQKILLSDKDKKGLLFSEIVKNKKLNL